MKLPSVIIPVGEGDASVTVVASVPSVGGPIAGAGVRFRSQLGLPTDRPIIMSGHQAEWWHPGILAKVFAARAVADRIGGVVVWLVVDQDDNDPGVVPIPVVRDARTMVVQGHRLAPEAHAATGWRDPLTGVVLPDAASLGASTVAAGLQRVAGAMGARSGEASLARQVGHAALDVAAEHVRVDHVIFASDLSRTDAWSEFVGRMAGDPQGCMAAYNGPASRLGAEHVRVLDADPARGRWELPLWSIDADGRRTRVWSDSPALADPRSVHPRALAMTALVRMHGCASFIHGTGGWGYDAVTDAWIASWDGRPLAPTGLATASLYLPFDGFPGDDRVAREATDHAHRARHDPGALGDARGRAEKAALVGRIAADRAMGRSGRDGYLALHRFLEGYREAHAEELAEAAVRGAAAREAYRRSRRAITARNWPFPWYDGAALTGLGRVVAGAVGRSSDGSNANRNPRSMPA